MLKWFLTLVAIILVLGLATPWLQRLGFGRQPADVRIERGRRGYYFPFVGAIILSLALALLMCLSGR
jgi:hypothetical protein